MTHTAATSPAKLLPVLVATAETQGRRKNDFFFCDDGESVRFTLECDGERVDGPCGCRRSMSGISTLKGTTTVRVKPLPMTREQFVSSLKDSYRKSGSPLADKLVTEESDELLRLAAAFPLGAVFEKRGDTLQRRA